MSLMDPTASNVSPEDSTEADQIVRLEEDEDVEQENLELGGVVSHVKSAFQRAKDRRRHDEERWLMAYRNYRGLYGPDVQFTDREKSQAFVKITKTKVLAAYAQIMDVLFAGSKFPLGIEAKNYPVGVAGEVHYDPNQVTDDKVEEKAGVEYDVPRRYNRPDIEKELGPLEDTLEPVKEQLTEGAGDSKSAVTFEPAKEAAREMEQKIHDQLGETSADKHLHTVAFESSLFGTGVMKGPFAFDKEYPRWNSDGEYDPEFDTIPRVEGISIWDFYPDPDARNGDELEFTVERHRLNKSQLRKLKQRPHFRSESVELAIDYGPSYQAEHWEHVLDDTEDGGNIDRYEVLEYGFMRMSVDNAALSGNLLIEVDETNLVPGQDMDIYPGKIFRRQAGAPGQAIFGTKFPNVSNELNMMFDKARQLADEATGMPSYAHGIGGVMGVGRTASGMSMLMGAAAQNIKAVVRNFDQYLLAPLGKALFAFNMQFGFDEKYARGDLDVKARGTESLMRNEVRSQRLLQFMQMTANPMMQPFVKYDYILRELAASMDLDEDKILNDPREALIQAKMMAEIQEMMPQPPQQEGGATSGQGSPTPGGPPSPSDPTGTGNGNVAPGAAPEPGAAGFTGAGGGANGGSPAGPPQGGTAPVPPGAR